MENRKHLKELSDQQIELLKTSMIFNMITLIDLMSDTSGVCKLCLYSVMDQMLQEVCERLAEKQGKTEH
jgi:GGDEF domain-containing protein